MTLSCSFSFSDLPHLAMRRHLVLLCVCCVIYTVTNGQEPEDTSFIPDEVDIQRTTVRPRPTGVSNTLRPNINKSSNANWENYLKQLEEIIDAAKDLFDKISKDAATPVSFAESINDCGLSSSSLVQAGEAMQGTEFPWLGGLFERFGNTVICNVNLVSSKHAVTAAECFSHEEILNANASDYYIRWGHPRDRKTRVNTDLSSIIVHPGYRRLHDVAVVVLSNSVSFTLSLKPICLWRTTWSPDKDITGTVASLGVYYQDIKKFEMPIVTQETCRERFGSSYDDISEFSFCARTRNLEPVPCGDDYGAGYMQWVKDRYYLRGFVSRIRSCDQEAYIVFADLSKEVDWLVEMIS